MSKTEGINAKEEIVTICEVLLLSSFITLDSVFYLDPKDKVNKLDLLLVPLHKRKITALCKAKIKLPINEIENHCGVEYSKFKPISRILLRSVFDEKTWQFTESFARYNFIPIKEAIRIFSPQLICNTEQESILSAYTINKDYENKILNSIKGEETKKNAMSVIDFLKKQPKQSCRGSEILLNTEQKKSLLKKMVSNQIICYADGEKKTAIQYNEDNFKTISLIKPQRDAISQIKYLDEFGVTLLYGVTGSGKTEVYCNIVQETLKKYKNGKALIILPEITMATSLMDIFRERFGDNLAVWHSSINNKAKETTFNKIYNNKTRVIIGARSAIFTPCEDLKIIIVDEEHDSSYKQSSFPPYNARNMAILRSKISNIPIILCSATPSIESYFNAINNKYQLVKLNSRFNKKELPRIQIIDSIEHKLLDGLLSKVSIDKINKTISKKSQVMIFVNRRGYSRGVKCQKCKYVYECPNCDVQLVYHKFHNKLLCHYCDHCIFISGNCTECLNCSNKLIPMHSSSGIGIESAKEKVQHLFPDARLCILSSDLMKTEKDRIDTLRKIQDGHVDIILSTQIGTKGLNFPNLVLIVVPDMNIDHIDGNMRIFEETYQLLVQVTGRAGRFEKAGEILIQTRNIKNPVIQAMFSDVEDCFYKEELERRKTSNLPPYSKQIGIITSFSNQQKGEEKIIEIYKNLIHQVKLNQDTYKSTKILGPIPNTICKIKKKFGYHILLQDKHYHKLRALILSSINPAEWYSDDMLIKIDTDPREMI